MKQNPPSQLAESTMSIFKYSTTTQQNYSILFVLVCASWGKKYFHI